MNLYGMVGNDSINWVDTLGLAKCEITLEFNHGDNNGKSDHKGIPNPGPCNRWGALGCNNGTDKTNDKANKGGYGIPDFPKSGNFPIGPVRPTGDPKIDDNVNGGHGPGPKGFNKFFNEVLKAANKAAKEMCKDKCKCKEVKIKVKITVPRAESEKAMGKKITDILWDKEFTVPCPE